MAEKSLAEIPRDLRDLYQKGTMAIQRQNFDYAIAILTQVLTREPGFFEGRQALRAAQYKKAGGTTSFFKKVIGGASSSPLLAKAQLSLRSNPLDAIVTAEQILSGDPHSSAAHRILAEAALAADLPKTSCLEFEILIKNAPKDYHLAMDYGKALAAAGQVAKAETLYHDLARAFPQKGEITQALKDLSARRTLDEGGYESLADGSGSYRDILKNKSEAVSLEQENRQVRSEDASDNLIREYESRLEREPGQLKLLRQLAELYTQKKEFDKALEYGTRLKSSEAGNDPSLDRFITDIQLRRFDHMAASLDPTAPNHQDEVARLKGERQVFQLEECKGRVDRYPTDLVMRFELGEHYFNAGKTTEAIGEFQKAQANPHKRLASLGYLAQCFARRGMNDSAVRMLQSALKEKTAFDDEKKDLTYQLGCVFEKMSKREEAIEQFKQIYELDISYKDVGAKVDAYYAQQ